MEEEEFFAQVNSQNNLATSTQKLETNMNGRTKKREKTQLDVEEGRINQDRTYNHRRLTQPNDPVLISMPSSKQSRKKKHAGIKF